MESGKLGPAELQSFREGYCPGCGGRLAEGPHGGMSVNWRCSTCGQLYCDLVFGVELIPEVDRCSRCLKDVHADGSIVTWKCGVCRKTVCRDCTLTIPGSVPREIYELTLCSKECWEKAGRSGE